MTVWKFPIPIYDEFTINMPNGAEILHVAVQHGAPCMWCRVDPLAPRVDRPFSVRGTGHQNCSGLHVGSFQMRDGVLVFHVFEKVEVSDV